MTKFVKTKKLLHKNIYLFIEKKRNDIILLSLQAKEKTIYLSYLEYIENDIK